MTKQEIFDKVAVHLLAQGKPSKNAYGDCMYRGVDPGSACAIGCLIPDELYDPKMEDVRVRENPRVRRALSDIGVDIRSEGVLSLLASLQDLHDEIPPEYWGQQLIWMADGHNLNLNALRSAK